MSPLCCLIVGSVVSAPKVDAALLVDPDGQASSAFHWATRITTYPLSILSKCASQIEDAPRALYHVEQVLPVVEDCSHQHVAGSFPADVEGSGVAIDERRAPACAAIDCGDGRNLLRCEIRDVAFPRHFAAAAEAYHKTAVGTEMLVTASAHSQRQRRDPEDTIH